MRKIIVVTATFLSLCIAIASAEISIKAEVDQKSATIRDTLIYKLIITSSEKDTPAPQLPKFENFKVVSQDRSWTTSLVKAKIKSIIVYAFVLVPVDIGRFRIEPSVVKMKDKNYSSDAFEIEVKPGKTKLKPPSRKHPSLPEPPQPETEQPQITL